MQKRPPSASPAQSCPGRVRPGSQGGGEMRKLPRAPEKPHFLINHCCRTPGGQPGGYAVVGTQPWVRRATPGLRRSRSRRTPSLSVVRFSAPLATGPVLLSTPTSLPPSAQPPQAPRPVPLPHYIPSHHPGVQPHPPPQGTPAALRPEGSSFLPPRPGRVGMQHSPARPHASARRIAPLPRAQPPCAPRPLECRGLPNKARGAGRRAGAAYVAGGVTVKGARPETRPRPKPGRRGRCRRRPAAGQCAAARCLRGATAPQHPARGPSARSPAVHRPSPAGLLGRRPPASGPAVPPRSPAEAEPDGAAPPRSAPRPPPPPRPHGAPLRPPTCTGSATTAPGPTGRDPRALQLEGRP